MNNLLNDLKIDLIDLAMDKSEDGFSFKVIFWEHKGSKFFDVVFHSANGFMKYDSTDKKDEEVTVTEENIRLAIDWLNKF